MIMHSQMPSEVAAIIDEKSTFLQTHGVCRTGYRGGFSHGIELPPAVSRIAPGAGHTGVVQAAHDLVGFVAAQLRPGAGGRTV